jgi:hypothetical protein
MSAHARHVGRGWIARATVVTAVAALGLHIAAPPVAASVVPANFEDQLVAKVGGPTAMAFTPDGRILVTSHFGTLHVIQGGSLVTTPAIDLSAKVCADKERGLLGVAVDPAFASNHAIYLYYTYKKSGSCPYDTTGVPVDRVSKFILPNSNVIDPATETVLIDNVPNEDGIHNAGDLEFGKDGNLYISIGDGGCDYAFNSGCGSQNDAARDQNILLGKILRITPSGGIPAGNPFQGTGTARCDLTGMTDPGKKCQETMRGVCGTRSASRTTRTRKARDSSSTTSANRPGRRSTSGSRAPTTAGTSGRARARAALGPTAARRRPA